MRTARELYVEIDLQSPLIQPSTEQLTLQDMIVPLLILLEVKDLFNANKRWRRHKPIASPVIEGFLLAHEELLRRYADGDQLAWAELLGLPPPDVTGNLLRSVLASVQASLLSRMEQEQTAALQVPRTRRPSTTSYLNDPPSILPDDGRGDAGTRYPRHLGYLHDEEPVRLERH